MNESSTQSGHWYDKNVLFYIAFIYINRTLPTLGNHFYQLQHLNNDKNLDVSEE